MEIIEDNPAARWLPSRHRFALARLLAFLIWRVEVRQSRPLGVDHLLLAIDRGQSAAENYSIAIWYSLTTICYLAAVLPFGAALSLLAAIPLAVIILQLPIYLGANSTVLMLLHFCASAYFATGIGPAALVGWCSLALFFLNALAWIIDRICGI